MNFDKTERNKLVVFDKTERNHLLLRFFRAFSVAKKDAPSTLSKHLLA